MERNEAHMQVPAPRYRGQPRRPSTDTLDRFPAVHEAGGRRFRMAKNIGNLQLALIQFAFGSRDVTRGTYRHRRYASAIYRSEARHRNFQEVRRKHIAIGDDRNGHTRSTIQQRRHQSPDIAEPAIRDDGRWKPGRQYNPRHRATFLSVARSGGDGHVKRHDHLARDRPQRSTQCRQVAIGHDDDRHAGRSDRHGFQAAKHEENSTDSRFNG